MDEIIQRTIQKESPIDFIAAQGSVYKTFLVEDAMKENIYNPHDVDIVFPERLKNIVPHYPEDLRRSRKEGIVILKAILSKKGEIKSLEVLKAVPDEEGFEEAAIRACSKWRYKPALCHGNPVEVSLTIRILFQLK